AHTVHAFASFSHRFWVADSFDEAVNRLLKLGDVRGCGRRWCFRFLHGWGLPRRSFPIIRPRTSDRPAGQIASFSGSGAWASGNGPSGGGRGVGGTAGSAARDEISEATPGGSGFHGARLKGLRRIGLAAVPPGRPTSTAWAIRSAAISRPRVS